MAASGSTLASLIQSKAHSKIAAIAGHGPLNQTNPMYFIEMCSAIGNGIGNNSLSLSVSTSDVGVTGTPPITGSGTGVGIIVDGSYFTEDLYTKIRQKILATFGHTNHQVFPPSGTNSGMYLKAICEAISESVTEHYSTAWSISTSHPSVYAGSGTISNGHISGLSSSAIKSSIISLSPSLHGFFWPLMVEEISNSYVGAIHNHSTASVTISGVCVPSPPPHLQLCGLPSSGSGSGNAS